MTNLPNGINAWIFLNEDEPPGTTYSSPDSCYQTLIRYKVYNSVDFLGLAFFEVVAASGGGSTIQVGAASHNQSYLNSILADARQVNPNIRFLATMVYSGANTLASVFAAGGNPQTQATEFANNLVAFLQSTGMNGMDVDWEPDVSNDMTQAQFKVLFSTIRQVFDQQPVKYYLTMAPAWATSTIDYPTLNSAFDLISPQFYDGTPINDFLNAGMAPDKIGYGAQFEPGNTAPNASAQQVWGAVANGFSFKNVPYSYLDIFMWRLNSGNFQFEQAQQMILYQLGNPPVSNAFDDSPIVGAAGNPTISQLTIRFGEVLNAIQAVNTGTGPYNTGTQNTGTGVFTLLQHGGNSGGVQTVNIPATDPIVSISGYTGIWYGWQCVLQLTLTGGSGATYGPFGSMAGASSRTPFTQSAPSGQSVVGFNGSTVTVPLADGSQTAIIASLNAVFA